MGGTPINQGRGQPSSGATKFGGQLNLGATKHYLRPRAPGARARARARAPRGLNSDWGCPLSEVGVPPPARAPPPACAPTLNTCSWRYAGGGPGAAAVRGRPGARAARREGSKWTQSALYGRCACAPTLHTCSWRYAGGGPGAAVVRGRPGARAARREGSKRTQSALYGRCACAPTLNMRRKGKNERTKGREPPATKGKEEPRENPEGGKESNDKQINTEEQRANQTEKEKWEKENGWGDKQERER